MATTARPGKTTFETPTDRELVMTRVFDAPRAESWGEDWPETLNTLLFDEQDGRTTLTQSVVYPSQKACDAASQSGMKEGVSISFRRLDDHLAAVPR